MFDSFCILLPQYKVQGIVLKYTNKQICTNYMYMAKM